MGLTNPTSKNHTTFRAISRSRPASCCTRTQELLASRPRSWRRWSRPATRLFPCGEDRPDPGHQLLEQLRGPVGDPGRAGVTTSRLGGGGSRQSDQPARHRSDVDRSRRAAVRRLHLVHLGGGEHPPSRRSTYQRDAGPPAYEPTWETTGISPGGLLDAGDDSATRRHVGMIFFWFMKAW